MDLTSCCPGKRTIDLPPYEIWLGVKTSSFLLEAISLLVLQMSNKAVSSLLFSLLSVGNGFIVTSTCAVPSLLLSPPSRESLDVPLVCSWEDCSACLTL